MFVRPVVVLCNFRVELRDPDEHVSELVHLLVHFTPREAVVEIALNLAV